MNNNNNTLTQNTNQLTNSDESSERQKKSPRFAYTHNTLKIYINAGVYCDIALPKRCIRFFEGTFFVVVTQISMQIGN